MFWAALPAVIGAVSGAATAGANIAANAGTGNTARIREIQKAMAGGDVITPTAKRDIDASMEIARRGSQQVSEDAARRAAVTGATSGEAARELQSMQADATSALYDRAAKAFTDARASEEQELEDRKALRRQRTVDTITSAANAAAAAGGATAQMQGVTYKGGPAPKEPDWAAIEKQGVDRDTVGQLQDLYQRLMKGGMSPRERELFAEAMGLVGYGV